MKYIHIRTLCGSNDAQKIALGIEKGLIDQGFRPKDRPSIWNPYPHRQYQSSIDQYFYLPNEP